MHRSVTAGGNHDVVLQRLPSTRAVERVPYLQSLARGKRVIHIGCCGLGSGTIEGCAGCPDPLGPSLHDDLAAVAGELVGIDVDEAGVERARARGHEAYPADVSRPEQLAALGIAPADVVIAGEVIEHIEGPVPFLRGMHHLVRRGGSLVVTTPNATSLLNPVAAMRRHELINPTHVVMYSWYTLTNVLRRTEWDVTEFVTYHHPLPEPPRRRSFDATMARLLARIQRAASTRWPFIDFGLIAVARPSGGPGG
jgi:2-polyprenyl-3-methyl-5-hydroxy-6-metoxy-1,4-benzoquinol methylase